MDSGFRRDEGNGETAFGQLLRFRFPPARE